MGTFGWDGERYQVVELTDAMVDRQVTAASEALKLAEKLLLVPAEGDRAVPEPIAELIRDMEPAYADTLIAALQDKRALLTDDLGLSIGVQKGPTIGAQKGTTLRLGAGLMRGAHFALAQA